MSQSALNLKFKGIHSDSNDLGTVPTGALSVANNINIDRDDIAEPRRGFKLYGNSTVSQAKQLINFKDRLLVHAGTTLSYDSRKLLISSITSTVDGTVTGITAANPPVISSVNTLTDGDIIVLQGTDCTPNLDGRWEVENTTGTTFELVGAPTVTVVGTTGTWHEHTVTATATTSEAHGLTTGNLISIVGSDYVEYNVRNVAILSTPTTTSFTFAISNPTVSPSTGTAYLQSGVWRGLATAISEPEVGRRLRSLELNGNLYITSSLGIRKLTDPTLDHKAAGVPRGLDFSLELANSPGFFSYDTQVAYRAVWGIRDGNNNLLLGAPSQRGVIVNSGLTLLIDSFNTLLIKLDNDSSLTDKNYAAQHTLTPVNTASDFLTKLNGLCTDLDADITPTPSPTYVSLLTGVTTDTADLYDAYDDVVAKLNLDAGVNQNDFDPALASQQVTLTVNIPEGITTDHFLQVYRSDLSAAVDVDPGDELFLAYEANPTAGEITAGQVVFTDITTEDFLGAALYSNATQEGANQTNEIPPFAKDIAVFKNAAFYANTRTRHNLEVALLGSSNIAGRLQYLDATAIVSNVWQSGTTVRYTFASTIDLTQVLTSHTLVVTGCANAANNGTFVITAVGATYVDVTNSARTSGALNEGAVGTVSFGYDTLVIGGTSYAFRRGVGEKQSIALPAASAIADSDYFILYSANDVRKYVVWYDKSGTAVVPSVADAIYVEVTITGGDTNAQVATKTQTALQTAGTAMLSDFTVSLATATLTILNNDSGPSANMSVGVGITGATVTNIRAGYLGESTSPVYIGLSDSESIGISVDETARSIVKLINKDVSNNVIAFYLSGVDDVPGKIFFINEGLSDPAFTVQSSSGASFSPDLTIANNSDNEELGNRIYYSKTNQPEAVPLFNYLDVGSRELPIQRIVALRDSLFVFKKDGIYRITGESVSSLQLSLFDNSAKLVAPESAVVGNNQVFAFGDQGVIAVSDTGISVLSAAIDNTLSPFYGPGLSTLVTNYAFGIFSETERKYFLWVPELSSDTSATQAYVYNTATTAWTRYPIAKTCGIVNPTDDKIYLGAADVAYIEQERKDFTYRDQADREISNSIVDFNVSTARVITAINVGKPTAITINSRHDLEVGDRLIINDSNSVPTINGKYTAIRVPTTNKVSILPNRVTTAGTSGTLTKITNTIQLSNLTNIAAGDVLVQPFYINVARFNALLANLDIDTGINDTDYFSTLKVTTFSEIDAAIQALATKLNADPGTTARYLVNSQSSPRNLQSEFNFLVETLNLDPSVSNSAFKYSKSNLLKEVRIVSVDTASSTVTIPYDAELANDECFVQKAIETEIEWVPQHAGDVSLFKQFSEMQVTFGDFRATSVVAEFKTELSPYLERVQLAGTEGSSWGQFRWGQSMWGVEADSYSMRTYVPTNKQRARFITPRLTHNTAYESFSTQGTALIFRTVSYRISR